MTNKIIVAIDGYSSCGKSTIAKALAKYAGYTYVDTGAMYRAIALYTLRNKLTETADIIAALPKIEVVFVLTNGAQHVTLNGEDVEGLIRTLEVGNAASRISQIKEVRAFLVAQQQKMGLNKGIVMDGRDIGTFVLPGADVKIYLTASIEERARRRALEYEKKGMPADIEQIAKDIAERDYRDMHREHAPLRQAEDAVLVDTSDMTIPEVEARLLELCGAVEDTKEENGGKSDFFA